MGVFGGPNVSEDGLVLALDGANFKSFKGESVTNLYYVSSGASANTSMFSMPMGGTATGSYTTSHSYGSWSGNTIFKVTVSSGTLAGGYESFRYCVPAAFDSTYGTTRRVSAKVKMLKGSITSLGYHNGGGTGGHSSSHYTSISESSVPTDVLSKDGWYQFDLDVSGSYPSGHCVGIGIVGSDIEFLVTEMMLYPSSTFVRFTPTTRGTTVATGGGWADLIGNGNNGELVNGVKESIYNGGSLSFDGSNAYVDVTTNLGILTGYTFCHFSRRDVENKMPIGSRGGPGFYQYGDNSWYYTHGGVAGEYYYPRSVSIPVGTWGFYCITYDGSAVRIYRNSVLEGSQATTGTANWTNGVRIGFWSFGAGYHYQGAIANFSMYNRALTAQEVSQNYNALRVRYGI